MMQPSEPPHNARQRPRVAEPYRDDPNAPPSVRLESFTYGGLGPPLSDTSEEKSKHLSLPRRCLQACCCGPAATNLLCRAPAVGNNNTNNDLYYYQDHFNDQSWSCTMGTTDEHGIWWNTLDPAGTVMSGLVWILFLYAAWTLSLVAATNQTIPYYCSYLYSLCTALALASHVKTTLTDPGAVPASAVPTAHMQAQQQHNPTHAQRLSMCSQCQTFKPPNSHHCRICNRCISRMDHHCPWMNNCVGAGNMKHFLLFLIYTWTCSVFCLLLLGWNYFFCTSEQCAFGGVLTQLVRIVTLLSIGSFLFTSSMLMNVVYGLLTGIGTIDRLKKKASNTMIDSDEEPIPLHHVFGIGPYWTWILPMDPLFDDYDLVMGYSTPQRLLREQMRDGDAIKGPDNYGMHV